MNIKTFWASFDYGEGNSEGCWIWKRAKHSAGYGVLRFDGRNVYVHRLAWELDRGPIPPGQSVLHRCDNPPCGRPSHLFLGTQAENIQDCFAKGRSPVGEIRTQARLTEAAVDEIRRRYADGERQYVLAREFGVSASLMSRVVHGKEWTHLLKETS